MVTHAAERPDDQPMSSAESVAFLRALWADPGQPVSNPDHLAIHFLRRRYRFALRFKRIARCFTELIQPGVQSFVLARTRLIDHYLADALAEGLDQVVILGAGNDSRAFRFSEQLKGVAVFEVDFPGTQRRKLGLLRQHRPAATDHVTFVPINFLEQDLGETLAAAGVRAGCRTFVIWEGGTMYLDDASFTNVVALLGRLMGPGSRVFLDYALHSFVAGSDTAFGAAAARRWSTWIREPYTLGTTPQAIAQTLRQYALEVEEDLGPEQLRERWLVADAGSVRYQPYGWMRTCLARAACA